MEYAILLVCGITQDTDKAKIKKLLSLRLKLMYPPAVAKVLLGGADPGLNVIGPFREGCCKDWG